ncbi:MAG: hypothetical protein VYE22_30070 [Myxococcota bacterium]|nr:hypothetical protein [Myxococcota bacterium]
MTLRRLLPALALLTFAPLAHAQGHGGVARSGMGQGEARISSRSDVRLSMESMPGTSGAAVGALGQRVGQRMAQIRGCYETVVEENPTVVGTLRLRVLLEGRGRPTVEVDRDGVNDAGLVRCITRELTQIDHDGLRRPTRAVVQLEMGNTAAAGAERAAARAQEAAQVTIQIDADGNATSSGGSDDRGVRFTVIGDGRESAPVVQSAHRSLLTVLPGLMDCRRRAGRRGQSPEGELAVTLLLRDGRVPSARVGRSTVESERARGCVSRVLRRFQQRAEASGRVRVRIAFAEAQEVETD